MLEKQEAIKSVSEKRIKVVERAIESMHNELTAEEFEQINAIILYGSTARGEAVEKSDLDIHLDLVDTSYYNQETFLNAQRKIREIIERELPEKAAITSKKIFPMGKIVKLICFNPKDDRKVKLQNSWKIMYAKSPEVKDNLENIFKECHQYMLQKFVHKENPYK